MVWESSKVTDYFTYRTTFVENMKITIKVSINLFISLIWRKQLVLSKIEWMVTIVLSKVLLQPCSASVTVRSNLAIHLLDTPFAIR